MTIVSVLVYYYSMTDLNNPKIKQLFRALLSLKNEDEAARFCRDLLTLPEINELAARLSVAEKLSLGQTQRQVAAETDVSIATVTRVNQWLRRGMGGYNMIIPRIQKIVATHSHKTQSAVL